MGVRICYVQRAHRGDVITGLRLVGERAEELWLAPETSPESPATHDAEAGAGWLAEKLRPLGGRLDVLCLDPDGAMCGWMASPTAQPEVVAALARSGGSRGSADAPPTGALAALADFAATPQEASVDALGAHAALGDRPAARMPFSRTKPTQSAGAARPQRLSLLAINDVPARLLIDALDARGISVGVVTTLWHALASVWDPALPAPAGVDRVPADDAPVTAIVLLDPCGRLVWAWSQHASLLSGGSMRLATDHSRPSEQAITEPGRTSTFGLRHVDPRVLRIAPHAAGRLVADWLAWSAQTGRSPLRIACLAPESMDQGELSAFGQALALSWPSAALDIATHPDPTAATLTRLAERVDDAPRDAVPPVASIGHSAHRPTRAHRTLLVASALAVAAVSAAVGMMAYRLRAEAHDAQTAALRVEDSWRKDVEGIDATLLNSVDLVPEKLKSLVARLTGEVKPVTPRNEVRQVLEELATLSLVLGDPEIHLASIDLSGVNVVVKVQSTLEQATEIANSLREIAGSRISTWVSQPDNERAAATGDGTFLFRITGTWGTPDAIKTASAVEKGKP